MRGIKTPFYYPTKADFDLEHPTGAYTQQSIDTLNEIYDVNRLIARNPKSFTLPRAKTGHYATLSYTRLSTRMYSILKT